MAISVASNAAVIGGSTVAVPAQGLVTTIGGQAVTVQPLLDPSNAGADPAASTGANQDPSDPANNAPSTFVVGAQTFTATPGQPLVIAGATLAPGSAITISGHTYSQGSSGVVVDGTSTVALPAAIGSPTAPSPTVVTLGSLQVTATPGQPIVISGSTLAPGSAVTVDGLSLIHI